MGIITDQHVLIYQQSITDVRQSIGRVAYIYLEPIKVDCTYCILDKVHGRSSGVSEYGMDWTTHPDYDPVYNIKVCPNCNGKGYTQSDVIKTVKGTKKDLSYNNRVDLNAGMFRPGTIRFSCDLADVLIDLGNVEGNTWFDRAIYVILDGEKYEIVNTTKSGLRDLYTCRVILERTNK